MAICGIYKITNKINSHAYIGQSIDVEDRWVRHKWEAYNGKETWDYPLYRAIRKYGLENFSFEILEECEREDLIGLEQFYIDYYNTFIDGYNQTSGGEGHYGQEKIVYQYDLNGILLGVYPNIPEASRQLNIKKQNIYKACRGERKTAGGYQWSHQKMEKPKKTTLGQGKRVYQYDLKGTFIKDYPSLAEASRSTGLSYSTLKRAVAKKVQQTAGGYIWTRERED